MKSSDIHIGAISQEMFQPSITKIRLKIACLKFHSNFPGVNELKITATSLISLPWRMQQDPLLSYVSMAVQLSVIEI